MADGTYGLIDTRSSSSGAGQLYVVATPIGNLEDISVRALRTLREVSLIACEDTRHTRKLLSHFQISTPQTSYYREREVAKTGKILHMLLEGRDVALVSDAGVPCVSDPGFVLVNEALVAGIRVVPIPGPCAVTTAISMAGLKADQFLFLGFLPAKTGERRKTLLSLVASPQLLVMYESPHRLAASLGDCLEVLGDRQSAVCRELTKIHEQCLRGPLSQLIAACEGENRRGEFVVLIEGAQIAEAPVATEDLGGLLGWYRQQSGLSLKDSVARVAKDLGLPRAKVYEEALKVWKKAEG